MVDFVLCIACVMIDCSSSAVGFIESCSKPLVVRLTCTISLGWSAKNCRISLRLSNQRAPGSTVC